MPTLLAVTVGGACTPIVTAIRDYSADHVCFIASAGPKGSLAAVQGEGDPCGDKRQIRCPHCGKPVALGDPHGPNIIACQTAIARSAPPWSRRPPAARIGGVLPTTPAAPRQ